MKTINTIRTKICYSNSVILIVTNVGTQLKLTSLVLVLFYICKSRKEKIQFLGHQAERN